MKTNSPTVPTTSQSDPCPIRPKPGTRPPLKWALWLLLVGVFGSFTHPALAADQVLVWPERAAEPGGPWTAAPVTAPELTTEGKLLLPADREHEYWRLRITTAGDLGFSLGLPLINVPPASVKTARDFLVARTAAPDSDYQPDEEWRQAKLADTVIPVYDPAVEGGRTPAYLEFKVIADEPTTAPASAPDSFRTTDEALRTDQGFILVSLTENDFPVADWATRGQTRIEKLRRLAGTALIKPLRFGSALLVAEDSAGGMRASEGSVFFKPSPELMLYSNYVGTSSADTRTGVSNRSPEVRLEAPFQSYGSYDELKRDYATNSFFQLSRARLRNAARVHWLIENGTPPAQLRVQTGQTATFFAGRDVRAARLETPDEDTMIARLTPLGTDGLRVDGLAEGSGLLYVQLDGREEIFTLFVTGAGQAFTAAGGAPFVPGWRTSKIYRAGTVSDQRFYSQYQSLVFGGGGKGNYVGCGPCAWTMLMGWWDLKGVPVIFQPYNYGSGLPNWQLGLPDAPEDNTYKVNAMMHDFRDNWIDPLYCNVVNGQCGTPPDKMAGGVDYFASLRYFYNLIYLPLLHEDVLGYGYNIKWSFFPNNGVNDFNKLARQSIHDGYPSIIGVGNLSHYPLAYAYIESRFEAAPGYFPYWRAWLKCNWGNGDTHYYKFTDDYFFATECQFWQTHTSFAF